MLSLSQQIDFTTNVKFLVGADALYLFECAIIRIAGAEGYYKFIDEGEDGGYCLFYRVIQFGAIPHHRKSADSHSQEF